MKRLTYWNCKEKTSALPVAINELGDTVATEDICAKLATYEDEEENGLLVRLPCKIGGTLYMISTRVDGKPHIRRLALTNQNMGNVLSRIGQDIYSDLESAEKAMEAMK